MSAQLGEEPVDDIVLAQARTVEPVLLQRPGAPLLDGTVPRIACDAHRLSPDHFMSAASSALGVMERS